MLVAGERDADRCAGWAGRGDSQGGPLLRAGGAPAPGPEDALRVPGLYRGGRRPALENEKLRGAARDPVRHFGSPRRASAADRPS